MKKRVVIVSDALYPWHLGGKEERYRQIAEQLESDEIEILFATMRWWNGPTPLGHVAISNKYSLYTKSGQRSIKQAIAFGLSTWRIFSLKPDLIEADQIPFLQIFPLKLISLILRIPLTVTWHEVWGKEYWSEYSPILAPLASRIEKLSYRLPDKFIAVSHHTAERLIQNGIVATKIIVVENGLNTTAINEASTDLHGHDVLVVGRLIAHKCVDILIHAMDLLRRENYKINMGIVGDGPERMALETKVSQLGLSKVITFHGQFENHNDVIGLMKKSKVFVSASEREGYGIAVREALAVNMKVILNNHPNNASKSALVNPAQGIILGKNTSHNFANAIREVLDISTSTYKAAKTPTYSIADHYLQIWVGMLR
jgi:glycosyltransferase involved in cell wall biosynthesis